MLVAMVLVHRWGCRIDRQGVRFWCNPDGIVIRESVTPSFETRQQSIYTSGSSLCALYVLYTYTTAFSVFLFLQGVYVCVCFSPLQDLMLCRTDFAATLSPPCTPTRFKRLAGWAFRSRNHKDGKIDRSDIIG